MVENKQKMTDCRLRYVAPAVELYAADSFQLLAGTGGTTETTNWTGTHQIGNDLGAFDEWGQSPEIEGDPNNPFGAKEFGMRSRDRWKNDLWEE